MAGKLRRSSKKSKAIQRSGTINPQVSSTSSNGEPAAAVARAVPSRASGSSVASSAARYAHVTTELKFITILSLVIIIILFVLSRILV
jgi:hypothetical protein